MSRKPKDWGREVSRTLKNIRDIPDSLSSPKLVSTIIHYNMLLGNILTEIMAREREQYLNTQNELDDTANGYFPRTLQTEIGKIPISVPRTRTSNFRSTILPDPLVRQDPSLETFIKRLLIQGLYGKKLKQVLKSHLLSFPEETVDELCTDIEKELSALTTKEIPCELLSLIIDAKVINCLDDNNVIKTMTLYQIYALSFNGEREVIYFEISEEKEDSKKWLSIFQSLTQRGLRKFLLIISDNLSGLKEAIKMLFPLYSRMDHNS
ncbi:MAG: transposase [Candidatus Hydrogenedentota bacterium]